MVMAAVVVMAAVAAMGDLAAVALVAGLVAGLVVTTDLKVVDAGTEGTVKGS